jgi:membrane protein YdbS with pleckstrin-like domain
VYKSKIDSWLIYLIGGILILPVILVLVYGGSLWPGLIICGLTATFTVWLYLATQYKVTKEKISIHAGLYKVNIPIKSIKSVANSNNPMASPAFSLDRLEITYGQNAKILISPKDKNRFLADIGWLEKSLAAN